MTLQQMMHKAGISQSDMSRELCLSESHISLMVSGQRRMAMDYAAVFAKHLDVSIDDIFLAINFAKRKVNKSA